MKNFEDFEKSIKINESEVVLETAVLKGPIVNKETEEIQFLNIADTKEAVDKLVKGGIKKEYITTKGKFSDTIKFINNHEYKKALDILKLQTETSMPNNSNKYETPKTV